MNSRIKNKKTRYIGYVATSIDGKIARSSKSGIDWTSKEDSDFYQNSIKGMDLLVVGHNTYKLAGRRNWKRAVVLTSKANLQKANDQITFLNPNKSDLKKYIESKNYKKIAIIGGGEVYDFCLKNQMLDELYVTIEPLVFTSGVTMFSGKIFNKHQFRLKSIKKLNRRGSLLLKYENLNTFQK